MSVASSIIERLVARAETLAVAESLTGGLLAATIVEVAGASAAFRGGLIVYATPLKATLAGVDAQLLDDRGPVDPEVARQLANGARTRCEATWGLATTGVAGPTPQNGIAVGTVFVAVAGPDGSDVRELRLNGGRSAIRQRSVAEALALLEDHIRD